MDDIGYTPGSGATIAADDVGGVLFQRVKLTAGADGTATDLPGDATNGLDVDVTRLPAATTDSDTLGALNDAVTVSLRGHSGASVQLGDGGASLALVAQTSHDGSTWTDTYLWEPALGTLWGIASFDFVTAWWIAVPAGATHVRVRVSSYTSGTVAAVLSAADTPAQPFPFVQADGAFDDIGMCAVVGGSDAGTVRPLPLLDAAPSAGAVGLVVRPVGPVPVSDNGGSLTVDGAVVVSGNVGVTGTVAVTDNNTTLSVDDGAGSLTVDGSVSLAAALPAGTNNIGDVDVLTLPALPAGTNNIGDVDVLTLPALPAGANTIGGVTDGGGSLTVDAPVGTPVFVRLSDGSSAISTLPVSNTQLPAALDASGGLKVAQVAALPAGSNAIGTVTAQGGAASDAPVSGNPMQNGGRAADAAPTAVSADGDAVAFWATRRGAQVVTDRMDIARVWKSLRYTATNAAAADTLLSLTPNVDGTDGGAATTHAVTSGKRFRVTMVTLVVRTTTAANPWGLATIRVNPSGAAVIGSPAVFYFGVGGTAAVAGNTASDQWSFPDGFELSGTQQVGISFANNVNTNVTNLVLHGYEYTP